MRSLPILKYDIKKAKEKGISGSIIEDVERMGYKVTNFERVPFGNCAIIEVSKLKKTNEYLTELEPCWEFEYKYPI